MAGEETTNSNIKQEFTSARSGLDLDSSVNQIQKGKLTYALNANIENFDGMAVNYQNESGNELCVTFPENFLLIGQHLIPEQNKHIFFLTNPVTGISEIGYMDNNDCQYNTLSYVLPTGDTVYARSACLNFSTDNPIHKIVHKITNCTTEIYWTDGVNPRRYLNINEVPAVTTYALDSVCEPVYTPILDCNKLKVQPNFTIPSLEIKGVVNGGDLVAGTYQFAIQYSNASGDAYTSFYSITNPTPIANTQLTTANFNYPVGRSIVMNIGNIDITGYFNYFNVAVIKTVNNIESVQLVGTYFIDSALKQVTYTGQNVTAIPLTLPDIFEKFPYYEIAQDLTAVRDILVWDDLTSIDTVNYQSIANQVTLQWQTYKMPSTETYANEVNATNLRSYLRDEVYAFELVFILRNGKQTSGFHIPGREKGINEIGQPIISPSTPTMGQDYVGDGTPQPYWKIYNTASVTGDAIGSNINNSTPYKYGEFAYWESSLNYPCNTLVWGDLADTPIRHHKFPDTLVSPIFDSATPILAGNKYQVTMYPQRSIYPIGVKINVQQISQLIQSSSLTQDQKEDIVAFKIVRGNRSTNQSIVAKGILRNVGKYTRENPDDPNSTYYYYPNYPYNDLNEDPFLLEDNNAYNSQCDSFKVVVTTAGTVQYTNCFTNEVTTMEMPLSMTSICSITEPTVSTGAAKFTNVTTTTFTVSYDGPSLPFGYSTILYIDPITLANKYTTVYHPGYGTATKTVNSVAVPTWVSGSKDFSVIGSNVGVNTNCYPSKINAFTTDESRYRQVFNSPETAFGQPTLGSILKLENVMYGAGRAHFVEVKKHAMYRLISQSAQKEALDSSYAIAVSPSFDATAMFTVYQSYLQIYINGITRQNYAYSFNSTASYDYVANIQNGLGIKQRELSRAQYLIPGYQSVGDTYNINNWNRESSVYLKTIDLKDTTVMTPLPFPNKTQSLLTSDGSAISDVSRFTASEKLNCATPEMQEDISVVSYYGSIKNIINDQWGEMYSYETIDTGFQRNIVTTTSVLTDAETIFGGDTFIGKFAFKTKLPFFIENRVGAPDDSDIFYDQLGNVAYPQYWYSARSILNDYLAGTKTLKNIISYKAHNLDCPNFTAVTENTTTTTTSSTTTPAGTVSSGSLNTYYDGKMYLFAYGIPYYFVESAINLDLRQAFNNLEGDFYPHVSSGIPDTWLQESVVPIALDNTYTYNVTYSKQNKENYFSHLPVDWDDNQCYTNFPFRAIYSDPQQSFTDNRINSWLIYRPISFFDFPQNYGKLVSLDGIQNKAILARFENKSLLYNTLLTIDTSNPQAAYMGNDKLFSAAPAVDFAETDLGYVGSQNRMLLKIPNGQITVDAKRGQVFLIAGNQATDLSAFGSGMNRFFTDHLAFEILRYYPETDIDNHYNGCGLHGVYDSKYDRLILTKLDYIPQPLYIGKILYDSTTRDYYINQTYGTTIVRKIVNLTDVEYFCNKSWTVSFNFNTKSWVSFHTYLPNFYIGDQNFYYSGLNEGCDLGFVAVVEIPTPTTTTTTTPIPTTTTTTTAVPTTTTTTTPTPTTTTTTTSTPITTTTTTTIAPSVKFTVNSPGQFPYPIDSGNGSASGTITNNLGVTIYVYAYFNSGGQGIGNINGDGGSIAAGVALIIPTGPITAFGQDWYSTNYETLISDNTSKNWSLSKQDGYSNGATLKLVYSTTIGGTKIPLNYIP